jgi:hypothetical protein
MCGEPSPRVFPARLIEITDFAAGNLRLVEGTNCEEKYVTLSYRWGDTAHYSYTTTTENYGARKTGFSMFLTPQLYVMLSHLPIG